MTQNIVLRKIVSADKPQLLNMMVEFYNSPALLHHTPKEVLSRVIDDCTSDMPFLEGYVAVDESNTILGYTMLSIGYSTEYGGKSIMIEDLYVVPNVRRHGIGERLINFVCDENKNTAVRIRLEVAPDNDSAVRLYKRCGLDEIEYKQMGKLLN